MGRFDNGHKNNRPRQLLPIDEGLYLTSKSTSRIIAREQCESPKVLRLYGYWQQLVSDETLPRRTDIDPGRIRDLLANIMIIELQATPLRWRYRLIGTAINAAMGSDATGKWLEEVTDDPDQRAHLLGLAERLLETRQAIFGQTINSRERRGCHHFHWALFPLRDDDDLISHALMIEDYECLSPNRPPASP
jgi:hypothetical protein